MDKITAEELFKYIWEELMGVILNMGMEIYGPFPEETGLEIARAIGTVMDKARKRLDNPRETI